MDKPVISSYCSIRPGIIIINDTFLQFDYEQNSNDKYLQALYRHLQFQYPKFYKMDTLSKLAFLTLEIITDKYDFINSYKNDEISIILSNSHSSLDTDLSYFRTTRENNGLFASPSQFVYTLPNIMIGELAIRHTIHGENNFFISKDPDPDFLNDYISMLFMMGKTQCCITGWIEVYKKILRSTLFIIEKQNNIKGIKKHFGHLSPGVLYSKYTKE